MFDDVEVGDLLASLAGHDFGDSSEELGPGGRGLGAMGASRIDAIRSYDRVICAAQARQAAQIAALHAERVRDTPLGRGDAGLSVVGELGMARNVSPGAAGTHLALALGLARLPGVAAVFESGRISEPTARAIVKECGGLGPDHLIVLDAEIAPKLPGMTRLRAAHLTARAVLRIDAEAAYTRARANRADCRVSVFPDTDGVATLWVRGPAEQIVAARDTLDAWATGLISTGDPRTRGQIMCQTLVERVTGITRVEPVDVEVGLVVDARSALEGGDEPVELVGFGPLCPDLADEIIGRSRNTWVRRLLTDPIDGTLVARDPRRRRFDGPLGSFIRARDRRCRQPGCDGAIRDGDHIHGVVDGGRTEAANGQGLCKRSHTIKGLDGWKVRSHGRSTTWTTPTGHRYVSHPPEVLPTDRPRRLRQ